MDIRTLMIDKHAANPTEAYDKEVGLEAIDVFNLHLKYNPVDAISNYHIGEIYTLLGQFEEGLQFMEKANQMDNINFDIQLGLMQSYLLTKNYAECERLERSVSRLYRKLTIPSRFTALMDYLYISAALAQDKKAKKETKELDKLLADQVVIDSWFYEPYLVWLNNCGCSEETRSFLEDLTTKMQERDLD
jgi:tetratricopeptide (TPR) repeat protein